MKFLAERAEFVIGGAGALHQIGLGAALAEPEAERLEVTDQAEIAARFGPKTVRGTEKRCTPSYRNQRSVG